LAEPGYRRQLKANAFALEDSPATSRPLIRIVGEPERKVRRHAVIRDQNLTNLRRNAFRTQNVSQQFHRGRMRRALRDVQYLDFH
jgi:hypothetical protein